MSEENTAQSNDNAVNNPSTKAGENNVENSIPMHRFSEVNNKYKAQGVELAEMKAREADRVEAEKVARGEFDSVLEKKNEENKALQERLDASLIKNKAWDDYQATERELALSRLPEEKKEFGEEIKDLTKLRKYVDSEVQSVNANTGKMSTDRQGVQQSEEFGGYSSMMEWVSKDPKGYEEAKLAKSGGDSKFGNIFGV